MALFLMLTILAGLVCGVWAFCLSWQAVALVIVGAVLVGIGLGGAK